VKKAEESHVSERLRTALRMRRGEPGPPPPRRAPRAAAEATQAERATIVLARSPSQLHVDRIEVDDDAGVLVFVLLSEHTEVLAELVEGCELIGRSKIARDILQNKNGPAIKSRHWRERQNTEARTSWQLYRRW
jgi:hypothetical protein